MDICFVWSLGGCLVFLHTSVSPEPAPGPDTGPVGAQTSARGAAGPPRSLTPSTHPLANPRKNFTRVCLSPTDHVRREARSQTLRRIAALQLLLCSGDRGRGEGRRTQGADQDCRVAYEILCSLGGGYASKGAEKELPRHFKGVLTWTHKQNGQGRPKAKVNLSLKLQAWGATVHHTLPSWGLLIRSAREVAFGISHSVPCLFPRLTRHYAPS